MMNLELDTLGRLVGRHLITLNSGTLTRQALGVARAQHIHHLPVMEGGTVLGLVCTCDLAQAPPDSVVDQWMSQPPVMLDAAASSREAARTMSEHGIGSVIVTYEDRALGIVTRGDLLAARPDLESKLTLVRCECCGLTRHLRRDSAGKTYCIHCATPAQEQGRPDSPG